MLKGRGKGSRLILSLARTATQILKQRQAMTSCSLLTSDAAKYRTKRSCVTERCQNVSPTSLPLPSLGIGKSPNVKEVEDFSSGGLDVDGLKAGCSPSSRSASGDLGACRDHDESAVVTEPSLLRRRPCMFSASLSFCCWKDEVRPRRCGISKCERTGGSA